MPTGTHFSTGVIELPASHPSPSLEVPGTLLTSSWMPWVMALCQVLMMASESCWIRYSEPSRLRSWRDTSHSVSLAPWVCRPPG